MKIYYKSVAPILFLILMGLLLLYPQLANAQSNPRNPCYYPTPTSTNCQPVTPITPLPVIVSPPPATSTVINCGGSIVAGGTAQPLFTATQYKTGFILEIGANDSNTDSLYFSDGPTTPTPGAGIAGSWSIGPSTSTAPGGSFTSPSNFPAGVIYYINGASTGDKYKCRVW